MDLTAVLLVVAVLAVACWIFARLLDHREHAIAQGGGADEDSGNALTQGEIEDMIRRAVREEVQPLREMLERLDARGEGGGREGSGGKRPRRDLPAGDYPEDPHDFGLIADAEAAEADAEQATPGTT